MGNQTRSTIRLAFLFLLLLLAGVASAQTISPEHRICRVSHFNRKAFIAEVSLLAAAKSADAITTRQLLDRGGWEGNPLFGRYPSPAKQAGINLGIFAAQSSLLYLTEHNRHAWVRRTGRAFLAHTVIEHARLAACNAGINPLSPVSQSCSPWVGF